MPTIRIQNKCSQPEMAADILEVDMEKRGMPGRRGTRFRRNMEQIGSAGLENADYFAAGYFAEWWAL